MEYLILTVVILVCSLVQSVLGVGLLVFGTPTLMILGYSFQETLGLVLPASLMISYLQMREGSSTDKEFRARFNFYCLPFVLLALSIVLLAEAQIDLSLAVGVMLILSGLIRFNDKVKHLLQTFLAKNQKPFLIAMGTIHGLTNMGGGLLTLYSSTLHGDSKNSVRSTVAYGYLLMGSIQYVTLIIFEPSIFGPQALGSACLSALTYYTFGKKLFLNTQDRVFQQAITGLIVTYGIILIVR